jgi:hypothetical protein
VSLSLACTPIFFATSSRPAEKQVGENIHDVPILPESRGNRPGVRESTGGKFPDSLSLHPGQTARSLR